MSIRQVRIWNPETNQFVFSGRTPATQSEFWAKTANLESPYEYETGLIDNNGKEIWEGDIIGSVTMPEIKATVEYTDGQFTGFGASDFHDLSIARGWSNTVIVIGTSTTR